MDIGGNGGWVGGELAAEATVKVLIAESTKL